MTAHETSTVRCRRCRGTGFAGAAGLATRLGEAGAECPCCGGSGAIAVLGAGGFDGLLSEAAAARSTTKGGSR